MNNHLYRFGRNVHGILLVDKLKGISSNDLLQKIKRIYNANHAGHTGTLDPLATGMMPICFGEATKFSKYLLNADKRYRVIAKLGQRTDTSDKNGQIIQERPVSFNIKKLNIALRSFLGKTLQIPSMYSALKYKGKRFYEYARKGIEIPREPRSITIYNLMLIRYEGKELELEIHCSKGTYIRTIIDDLGEKLGCGGHVTYLRRLTVGKYPTERMVKMEQIYKLTKQIKKEGIPNYHMLDSLLMPIDSLADHYPIINLPLKLSTYFKNGNPVRISRTLIEGFVRVIENEQGKFIGIGKSNDKGWITPCRLVSKYLE